MLTIERITPAIGAVIGGIDFSRPLSEDTHAQIYQALLDNLVLFVRGASITPAAHLDFAKQFGDLDDSHLYYPHVPGFENIVLLENDAARPPDTNGWHTDLTFKAEQPFASILIARQVPPTGGDTLWASCYAAYQRLPEGMQRDLEELSAVHDLGDFRNSFAVAKAGKSAVEVLNESVAQFGHNIRPLVGRHPISGRKFLNFNESFVTHIIGKTANEASSLKTYLANLMNRPEHHIRWRWSNGDLAMWDNRVTMHYAVADYLPHYRCMNRITVVRDRREKATRLSEF